MTNIKIYQICHNLISYFVTLTSPKKINYVLYLGPEGVLLMLLLIDDWTNEFCCIDFFLVAMVSFECSIVHECCMDFFY